MKTATPEPTTGLPTGFDDPESFFYIPKNRREAWTTHAPDASMAGVYGIARNIATHDEYVAERARRAAAREVEREPRMTRPVSADVRSRLGALLGTSPVATSSAADMDAPASEPALERLESLAHTAKPALVELNFDERVTQRLGAALATYTTQAEHVCRALHVLTQIRAEETRQATVALIRKHWECPVCGDSSGGAPTERSLAPLALPSMNVPRPESPSEQVPTIVCCGKCFIVAQDVYLASVRTEVVKAPATTRESLIRAALIPSRRG